MDIRMLRRRSAAMAAAGVLLLAGCSQSRPVATTAAPTTGTPITAPAAPVRGDQVTIDGFAFAPVTLTVPAGATVTWTNRDEEPHTVAASDGSFHSPGMGTGATFTHTFPTAGTFDYVCSIHPMMRGTVVVTG
ncbi:cupredoxin domain-containing protein [Mycobacterium colombiense]|uniref:cupredoxin domain-containing protein n=1 Tax=Mycobacterium colombiense TaxID=339268 RepID=UPI00200A0B0A|nr:cupredoxin family copper-binding protein [Mycobacterium colombiense]MCK8644434.1 cupredoxin family copper-binding protein [Mycobacterium colombiense]